MFITIEGIEGSGKSTLLAGLLARLREARVDVVATREPGGTVLGNCLRSLFINPASKAIDPLAEAFMLNASRAQLVAEIIAPALQSGRWVLCDRYTHATLAYQGYGRGLAREDLRRLSSLASKGITPDFTLLIDIPPEVSRLRVTARAKAIGVSADRLEREEIDFHARVRKGYLELAHEDARIKVLDGMVEERELLDRAWELVQPYIKVRAS